MSNLNFGVVAVIFSKSALNLHCPLFFQSHFSCIQHLKDLCKFFLLEFG